MSYQESKGILCMLLTWLWWKHQDLFQQVSHLQNHQSCIQNLHQATEQNH
uniref:Uncharacterized protein n=1 Tax=uncultured marine virus TaxID=186617 RepID=A0A0F7L346_9VIRU|nr:hypothetical protein [uncultured marine virus]